MTTIKTSELTGAALDWAVAKCEGEEYRPVTTYNGIGHEFPPTLYATDWAQGGPIIERERIAISFYPMSDGIHSDNWGAWAAAWSKHGPTPLIAAMRCYVTSKLGDEVEIPGELMPRTTNSINHYFTGLAGGENENRF